MSEVPAAPSIVTVPAIEVEPGALIDKVRELKAAHYRFMSTTCLDKGDHFDIYYHFDVNLTFLHLLVHVDKSESVPSITSVYFCAFLPENEMRDLFGIVVDGLNIDYDGHFLLTDKYDRPPLLKDPQPEKA